MTLVNGKMDRSWREQVAAMLMRNGPPTVLGNIVADAMRGMDEEQIKTALNPFLAEKRLHIARNNPGGPRRKREEVGNGTIGA